MRRLVLAIALAAVLPAAVAQAPSTAPAASSTAAAAPAPVPAGPYVLPPLPYAADALEVAIDAKTMTIHHANHHGAQVNALNTLAATVPELKDGAIEPLLARISTLPTPVRNNLGGHYNHALFWEVMAPPDQTGAPSPALAAAIDRDFGSFESMKQQFSQAAATRFGSGWAWMVVTDDGRLAIGSTPNQDNPLMDVSDFRGTPVLGLDVWEHAFYLRYQWRRGDYIGAWWDVVNWNEVSRRYDAAMAARNAKG